MSTLFTGISELHTVSEAGTLDDAAIVVTDGVVSWVGQRSLKRRPLTTSWIAVGEQFCPVGSIRIPT